MSNIYTPEPKKEFTYEDRKGFVNFIVIEEPMINGVWYYLLDKMWTRNGKVL